MKFYEVLITSKCKNNSIEPSRGLLLLLCPRIHGLECKFHLAKSNAELETATRITILRNQEGLAQEKIKF